MTVREKRPAAICVVMPFVFRHWLNQPVMTLVIAFGLLGATVADLFMPLFSGHLVDALTRGAEDADARRAAVVAFTAASSGSASPSIVLRMIGLQAIVLFTLKMMSEIAANAFHRVQRFSTDWHANSFAGSTVRKITRGMWALDLLNDTLLIALFPSLVVLVGATVLLGWRWPMMGAVVGIGSVLYIAVTVAMSLGFVAPAARLANAWDTRMGGALADAVSCNGW